MGFDDPIGIWGENNIIVEGHGRLMAAKELHLEKVPCIRLDHLTDEQRREYAIRHNRSQERSTWDFELLAEELAALDLDGIDMSDLDFKFDTDPITVENTSKEYGEEEFGDEQFECECPRCGFKFNRK